MTYYELLPYVFKKFSLLRALRTGPSSTMHYLKRTPLPKSNKPALFTMNIMPPMMTVWYHFAKKNLKDNVDIVIFDSSGTLNPKDFPGARVQKFVNLYAATKSDEFLYHIANNRKLGWICDDDMFVLSEKCINHIREEFTDRNTASLSFRPRPWWHFEIDGKEFEPSSSYSTVINREIFCDKEHLSLSPCDGNTHVSHLGKPLTRFDTFDKANETLLKKGYRCAIVPEHKREELMIGFSGTSSAVMLLWHFRTASQMMDYLEGPEDKAWRGNTLFTVLSGLRAISAMQQMHSTITGKPYVLRSMPSPKQLEILKQQKKPLLRKSHSFDHIDMVADRLRTDL